MQMSKAQDLLDKGIAFHKSGKHAESIKALHAATKILGVAPYKPMGQRGIGERLIRPRPAP